MEIVKGYFDYCVSESCITEGNFEETAKLFIEMGYRTIAINQILEETNLAPKKKKKKGESRDVVDIVPVPVDVSHYEDKTKLKILNRLTIAFSNQEIFNKITKSVNYKKYHIIAVLPLTQAAIQYTSGNIEADILSFDAENKVSYKLTRKLYNQFVDKGVHFELLYSPAIQDRTHRKNTIHVSHLYHSFGKSRNVIISSGATKKHLLRGPYDIINLGLIFGLSEEQAKNSILSCGRNVFLSSVGRRRGKTFMLVETVESSANGTNFDIEGTDCDDTDEMEVDEPAAKKHKL